MASHTNPSKFVLVPSVWNQLKIREIYMGQYQTFGCEIQIKGNFWQGPFSKEVLLENGAKSHNFTNLFFMTSHFGTLLLSPYSRISVKLTLNNKKPSREKCSHLFCSCKFNFKNKDDLLCYNQGSYPYSETNFQDSD